MQFLVDGYNLMHAVGLAPAGRADRPQFDAARRKLLDWLADSPALRSGSVAVRIVFDAQNSTRDLGSTAHRGLTVTYSFRETADDLIETFLAADRNPRAVRVVSNDGRLRAAAKHSGGIAVSCGEFVDWLQQPPKAERAAAEADEKPHAEDPDGFAELLQAFQAKKPR